MFPLHPIEHALLMLSIDDFHLPGALLLQGLDLQLPVRHDASAQGSPEQHHQL